MGFKNKIYCQVYFLKIFLFILITLCNSCSSCSSSGRKSERSEREKQQQKLITNSRQESIKSQTPISTKSTNPSTEGSIITDVVAHAEKCVFVVYAVSNDNVVGQGTGFFISPNGTAVSNHHVFAPGSQWFIKMADGTEYPVQEVVKSSTDFDYVVFEVDGKGKQFPYLMRATVTPLKGEEILVLGNPKGLESTLSRGVVSAIRNQANSDDIIQIDAAISPGSSGSPVMNLQGNVVGIATKKRLECENCNFAYNIKLIQE